MSSTRQLGPAGAPWRRNSCADSYASAWRPTDRTTPRIASRTDASSSTTNTIGRCSIRVIVCLFGGDRQGESKDRAVRLVWRRGQLTAVGLDDRTADRQPHPHAARLGGVEGIEHHVGA